MKKQIICFITIILLSISSLSFAAGELYCDVEGVEEDNCFVDQIIALNSVEQMMNHTDNLCDKDHDGMITEEDISSSEYCIMRMMTFYICMKAGEVEDYDNIYDYTVVDECMQKTYDYYRSQNEI